MTRLLSVFACVLLFTTSAFAQTTKPEKPHVLAPQSEWIDYVKSLNAWEESTRSAWREGSTGAALMQTTTGYKAVFTASASHNVIENQTPVLTSYRLVILAPGGTTPAATLDLGKPTPDGTNTITVDVNSTIIGLPAAPNCNPTAPTSATCYTARVTAVGSGGTADSNLVPFALAPRAPLAPGSPVIRRE